MRRINITASPDSLGHPNSTGAQGIPDLGALPQRPTFDLGEIRIPQRFDEALRATQRPVRIDLRKPNRDEWFRVHPDPEHTPGLMFYKFGAAGPYQGVYAVHPRATQLVPKPVTGWIATAVNSFGVPFAWPLLWPPYERQPNCWHESAMRAAQTAGTAWTQMRGVGGDVGYEIETIESEREPQWPELSPDEFLELALAHGRLIDGPDHPVVRALRGPL